MADNRQQLWLGLSALYAVGTAAAALLWPGPGAAPELPTTPLPPAIASPPVDVQIKPGYLSRTSAEGSARVFWTVPEDGSVKLTIEIPPDKSDN